MKKLLMLSLLLTTYAVHSSELAGLVGEHRDQIKTEVLKNTHLTQADRKSACFLLDLESTMFNGDQYCVEFGLIELTPKEEPRNVPTAVFEKVLASMKQLDMSILEALTHHSSTAKRVFEQHQKQKDDKKSKGQ